MVPASASDKFVFKTIIRMSHYLQLNECIKWNRISIRPTFPLVIFENFQNSDREEIFTTYCHDPTSILQVYPFIFLYSMTFFIFKKFHDFSTTGNYILGKYVVCLHCLYNRSHEITCFGENWLHQFKYICCPV